MTRLPTILAAITLTTSPARSEALWWPLTNPAPYTVCDANYRGCANGSTGVSARLTAQQFGKAAAKRVNDGKTTFSFSNGVACGIYIRSCWSGDVKQRTAIQRALFGF